MLRTKTDSIVIHSSATPPRMDIGVDEIRKWHLARGWRDVGYHFIITRDGAIQHGRDRDEIGAHSLGSNHDSIGICLVGGVADDGKTPEFNFTKFQLESLEDLLNDLLAIYYLAEVVGHRDVMPPGYTECPSFDVGEWWGV